MMKLIRFRTDDGSRMAIAGAPGRIYTRMVWIDSPIRVRKIPNGDVARYSYEVAKPSIKAAARSMLRAGRRLGITKSAKQHLREARA